MPEPPVTNTAFGRRLAVGKSDTLESCYTDYYATLVKGLTRLHGRDGFDAEDVAHQAFEKLADRLGKTDIRNPEAFVWRVAQNLALRLRRRERRREHLLAERAFIGDMAPAAAPAPDRLLSAEEDLFHINQVLGELSERRRQVLLLRCIDGLNYTQISDRLGISRKAVTNHLTKAIAEITDQFADFEA